MVVREVPALPTDAPYAEVAALAADLLAPFHDELEQLGTDDRLIISPDLTLLGLPFAAVQEHGIISHVHGAGMLEALGDRARRAYEKALLVGAPARADLPDLPAARREVKSIRGVFPAGRTLLGPAATVPGLLDGIADQDVLHFACHATISGAESAGRLMLAPDLVAGDSGELSEDRVLAEVSPDPGCLVNLAGCRTAHQAARPGPLIAGLVPVFLAAGAGHVLAALWRLDDEAAMTFQTAFYRELERDGHPPAALARCRRLAGKGALGEAVRAPEAWAGYVLYGI
jgi:CHAT domain-containing protein